MPIESTRPVKVSVLIPTYNGAPYLAEAIESVFSQSLEDLELIIADDGSMDGTQDIARAYAARDSRVVFYQNERNLGCVKNINRLILNSRGRYIKVLIQDDVLAPTCLEEFARVLDTHCGVSLVTSYQRFIGDNNSVRKLPTLPAIGLLDGRLVQRHVLTFGNWIGGETAVMIRRSALSVGLFNSDWVWQVDQDMWLRILFESDLYVVPQILTYPRIHGKQGTVTLNTGYRFIREELMQRHVAFMLPGVYGSYSKEERRALLEPHLLRLIEKGIDSDQEARKSMIEIGREFGGVQFWSLYASAWKERFLDWLLGKGKVQSGTDHRLRRAQEKEDRAWKAEFSFTPEHAVVDLGFGTIGTIGTIRVPLELLRSPILSHAGWRVVALEETPHFRWIRDLIDRRDDADSKDAYQRYLRLFHPDEDIDGTLLKIAELAETIRSEVKDGETLTIVSHPPSDYQGQFCVVIYDGNHRACIAKALGHSHITCRLVEIRMRSDYFPANFFEQPSDMRKREAREIDAWLDRGKPPRPPHGVKVSAIQSYAEQFSLHTLIETGTYLGDMVEACRGAFARIFSVELSRELFEKARERFAPDPSVAIVHGDSSEVLPQVLAKVDTPALFWLDAHYSGGITAQGTELTPIFRELEIIFAHPVPGHVILIDDAGDFIGTDGYPTLAELKAFVQRHRPGIHFEVRDDIIRIHR